jgi:sugar phosphate isomerase/epimerase
MKLAAQEHLIPGGTLGEKWDVIQQLGYEGIELRGQGDFAFEKRLKELQKARADGAYFPSVCVNMPHFIGDFDKTKRRDAIENMKSLLSVIAEVGGKGAITPASYGMHSNRLPPFTSPRSPEEDERVLLEGLQELGEHAARHNVKVFLEPLNRYEDHMINTLEQGVALCKKVGLPSVILMADLYHMNIEEKNSAQALIDAKDFIAHIHLADSNRLEPGQGQTDFARIKTALAQINYGGFLALECRLKDEPLVALTRSLYVFAVDQS